MENQLTNTSDFTTADHDDNADRQSRKRSKDDNSTIDKFDETSDENMKENIVFAWKDVQNEINLDKAFTTTMTILSKQIDGLIRSGLDAFHRAENATVELRLTQDEVKLKDIEIDRLRFAEEKTSTSLAVSSGLFSVTRDNMVLTLVLTL